MHAACRCVRTMNAEPGLEVADPLRAGREALRRGEWEQARAYFEVAHERGESPEAMEALAMAAWWLDDGQLTIESRERAYRLYREMGDAAGAARMAIWLAWDYLAFRGEPAVARGWLQRAHRLLAGLDPVPEHGWLAIREGEFAFVLENDLAATRRWAGRARAIGSSLGVDDIELSALGLEGLGLASEGRVADGIRQLDEASARANESSVVGIFAPAGYGKTTLLAQSVGREQRPVAWVSLDEGDSDPVVLLSHVAVAVDRVLSLTPTLFAMLESPGAFQRNTIDRVCSERSALSAHVLVLDDIHLVSGTTSRDAIAALALHAGQDSQTVLSGRSADGLPIARLRAAGQLLEIGAADLALDAAETRAVLEHARLRIDPDDAALLARRTEGWAIAVYLAARSLGASGGHGRCAGGVQRRGSRHRRLCALGVSGGPHAVRPSFSDGDVDSRSHVWSALRRGAGDNRFRAQARGAGAVKSQRCGA